MMVGPMVTNPATRDWTVTASLFATLNEMYGNRTICGMGRGDSAVRAINGRPVKLAEMRDAIEVIRALANGRSVEYRGSTVRLPWNPDSRLPIWVAGYGPNALRLAGEVGDGFILQLADPDIAAWSIAAVREAAAAVGRDPEELTMCVAAPAYVTDGSDAQHGHALEQCRWFGGMVGNHVHDIVERYGDQGAAIPTSLSSYIAGRQGYDYNEHGRAGNTHTEFVPDEIVERFCLIGPAERHVERLQALAAIGVDHFGLYLQHDAQDATLSAYGERVLPHVNVTVRARD
jgi:probable F420-dependent oxidoreductase